MVGEGLGKIQEMESGGECGGVPNCYKSVTKFAGNRRPL